MRLQNNGDGTWTLADNTISTLPAATYSVTVTATDAATNVGTDGTSNELIIDLTDPVVTITSKLTNDQTPSLAGTVDDTAATVNVNVNSSNYAATNNGDGTWTLADNTISTLPAATYSVTVTATDAASNVGTDGTSNELTIDITDPVVTITSRQTNDQTPSLAGTVDDTTATVNVNVNGSNYAATNNGDGTWTLADNAISTLPAATYSVTVTATDAATNVGTDSTIDELIIDLTDPVTSSVSPASSASC